MFSIIHIPHFRDKSYVISVTLVAEKSFLSAKCGASATLYTAYILNFLLPFFISFSAIRNHKKEMIFTILIIDSYQKTHLKYVYRFYLVPESL
jgi:hypothetical protein